MSNKDQQLNIRCTDQQREQWERAAELDRRTITDWIRITLDDISSEQIQAADGKKAVKK